MTKKKKKQERIEQEGNMAEEVSNSLNQMADNILNTATG